ncbi:MAG: hypothetical protein VX438_19600, partial [Planctomycetota bacterium]|nr:hypothetical protein [Planctomycetota bacterium]
IPPNQKFEMSQAVNKTIPEAVSSKLTGLRFKIGSWLLIEGVSRLLPTILGLMLFGFTLDYFLEMDIPQRVIISLLSVIVISVVTYIKLIRPFTKRLSDDALCLQVEKQNRNLHDSLISAVQFSRDMDLVKQGVSSAMVEATIERGTNHAQSLNFGTALNGKRLLANMVLSGASAVLLAAFVFGMLFDPTLRVFMGRMFFYDGSEYAKNTYLEFYDPEGQINDGVMKIYRGQDCTLLVRVRDDSKIPDVKVKMHYRDRSSNNWIVDDMTRTKSTDIREFKIVYQSVAVEFEVQARGGDGKTKKLKIKLDEPPQFNELSAEVIYPDYAVEVRPGDLVRVFDREKIYQYLGPRTDNPECWQEQIGITGTGQKLIEWGLLDAEQLETVKSEQQEKPGLTYAQIARKLDLFTESQFAAKLKEHLKVKTVRSEYARNTLRDSSDFLESFGGKLTVLDGCSIQFNAVANCELKVAQLVHTGEVREFARNQQELGFEVLIPAAEVLNGRFTIKLRDPTLRQPPRAAGFEIEIKADESPEVRAALKGISGLVINRAKIPFTTTVTDDFGVTELFLRYSWQDDAGENKDSGVIQFDEYERVRSWDRDKPDEVMKVSQILPAKSAEFTQQFFDLDAFPKDGKIPEGAGLKITIVAMDNDNVPSPNSGVSKEFLLRVVSEEEFRADLLRREKEARQEFDLIYRRQINTQTDTEALAADSKTVDESEDQFYSELKKKISEYTRSQRIIGENIEGVIERMEDLLTEGINNRLDESTGEFESRYAEKIIAPMQGITDELMVNLKSELDSARRQVEDNEKRSEHLVSASGIQKQILAEMEAILQEMEKNEGIQEIINRVFEAKKLEEKLRKQTEEEKKKRIKGARAGDSENPG